MYAEISLAFERIEKLDEAVPSDYFTREALPWEAAFLAARAFRKYRRHGSSKRHPLPDF